MTIRGHPCGTSQWSRRSLQAATETGSRHPVTAQRVASRERLRAPYLRGDAAVAQPAPVTALPRPQQRATAGTGAPGATDEVAQGGAHGVAPFRCMTQRTLRPVGIFGS